MRTVGERLRERREKAGLTLGQAGEYEGISAQYLSRLERGVNDPSVWGLLLRLAKRYRTSTDYLLGLTDDPGFSHTLTGQVNEVPMVYAVDNPEQSRIIRDLVTIMQDLPVEYQGMLLEMAKVIESFAHGGKGE